MKIQKQRGGGPLEAQENHQKLHDSTAAGSPSIATRASSRGTRSRDSAFRVLCGARKAAAAKDDKTVPTALQAILKVHSSEEFSLVCVSGVLFAPPGVLALVVKSITVRFPVLCKDRAVYCSPNTGRKKSIDASKHQACHRLCERGLEFLTSGSISQLYNTCSPPFKMQDFVAEIL